MREFINLDSDEHTLARNPETLKVSLFSYLEYTSYNMNMSQLQIVQGVNLTDEQIHQMVEAHSRVFHSEEDSFLKDRHEFEKEIFFILTDKDILLSFGRLRPIELQFMLQDYLIQGIASVVSVVPGKGYGRQIMAAIKKYLLENDQVGIGFCEPENSDFYRKCGIEVFPGLTSRFYYINSWTGERENYESDTIFYGKDRSLIDSIVKHPEEKVLIPYPW